MVSFPLFPKGYTTAKYRSMAMAIRVETEANAPTHATFPPVSRAHNTFPVTPSGWLTLWLKIIGGIRNVEYTMSATARFTSR